MRAEKKPLLLFDGDCRFCRGWVERWKRVAGERVEFTPYQKAAGWFPRVEKKRFQEAVQLFEGGKRFSGAEAIFRVLSYAPLNGHWLRLYKAFRPFARASEAFYSFVAGHRPIFSKITRRLWGDDPEPSSYFLSRRLFVIGLGLAYLAAFGSLYPQVPGLYGDSGISPVAAYLQNVHKALGDRAYWALPSFL